MDNWINTRKEFLLGLMQWHCKMYNIQGWDLKFSDLKKFHLQHAGAICHGGHKTIYVNTNHLGSKVPALWHYDMFLHEFAHLLNFENDIELYAIGIDGYKTRFSHHGRIFRKTAHKLGVGKQAIPTYSHVD